MFDCSNLCEVDLSQQLSLSLTYLRSSPSVLSAMASMKQTPRMSADEVRLVREMVHNQGKPPSEVAPIANRGLSYECRPTDVASALVPPWGRLRSGALSVGES